MKKVDPELIDMMPGKIFKLMKIGDCSLYRFIAGYYSKGEHVLGQDLKLYERSKY